MILALALLVTLETSAQKDDKYVQVMQKNITLLDSAKSIDELQSLAGTFDRIGDAEKTKWLPYYYAALAQTWVGWNPATKDKDANSAKINAFLAKAEAEWQRIVTGAALGRAAGLEVHAGHGLDYQTAETISALPEIAELNIGYFMMGEALFVGLGETVRQMRAAMDRGRQLAAGRP